MAGKEVREPGDWHQPALPTPPPEGHLDSRGCSLPTPPPTPPGPGSPRGTGSPEMKGFQGRCRRGEAPQADLGFPASMRTGTQDLGSLYVCVAMDNVNPFQPSPLNSTAMSFSFPGEEPTLRQVPSSPEEAALSGAGLAKLFSACLRCGVREGREAGGWQEPWLS